MSSDLIGKVLCTLVFVIGVAIGILAGLPGWGLGLVLMISTPFLHAWGCHRAEIEGAKSALIGFRDQLPPSGASRIQSTPEDE
jgi:hypothetical protein